MKSGRDHIVPMSNQVVRIFKEQHEEVNILNTPWVFPSQVRPRDPMSDGTVNKAIKRLGYKLHKKTYKNHRRGKVSVAVI